MAESCPLYPLAVQPLSIAVRAFGLSGHALLTGRQRLLAVTAPIRGPAKTSIPDLSWATDLHDT